MCVLRLNKEISSTIQLPPHQQIKLIVTVQIHDVQFYVLFFSFQLKNREPTNMCTLMKYCNISPNITDTTHTRLNSQCSTQYLLTKLSRLLATSSMLCVLLDVSFI